MNIDPRVRLWQLHPAEMARITRKAEHLRLRLAMIRLTRDVEPPRG